MEWSAVRRHLRITAYLPAQCTMFEAAGCQGIIEGKTQRVGPGGALLLTQASLPMHTRLLVRLGNGPAVQGRVVWTGYVYPTDLGILRSHGIAFEQDLDASALAHVLKCERGQHHPRLPARIPMEYIHRDTSSVGMCLNLSQGGMFIGTARPLSTGQDLLLHLTPPGLRHSFTLPGRVAWTNALENMNFFHVGMGVQFLNLGPTEQMHITALLDKIRQREENRSPALGGVEARGCQTVRPQRP